MSRTIQRTGWHSLAKPCSLLRRPRSHDAAKSDVTHACVNHLGLTRRRPVTQTVIRCAQMRSAFHNLAWNSELRLRRIVTLIRRGDARVDRWTTTGFDDFIGEARNVPVAGPLPSVVGHVKESIAVWRKGSDRRRTLITIRQKILPGEFTLP